MFPYCFSSLVTQLICSFRVRTSACWWRRRTSSSTCSRTRPATSPSAASTNPSCDNQTRKTTDHYFCYFIADNLATEWIQFTNGRRNKTESETNYFKPTLETTQTWRFNNDMIDEFKVIRSITFSQCFVSIINYFGMYPPCVLTSWEGNDFSSGGIITVQFSERLKCV